MINTSVFDYINVLGAAADASWLRNELINNNLANATTPGYKRQDTNFEEEFKRALKRQTLETMDGKVSRLNGSLHGLRPRVYTDSANFSYRVDGNNVDPDTEQVMLAKNQLKYEGITNAITAEFQALKMVMNK